MQDQIKKEIYLIGSDKCGVTTEMLSLKKVADIHRVNYIDSAFVGFEVAFSLIKKYCDDNETKKIEFQEIGSEESMDNFLHIVSYIKKNPNHFRLTHIGKKEDLGELEVLFQKMGFATEKIVL